MRLRGSIIANTAKQFEDMHVGERVGEFENPLDGGGGGGVGQLTPSFHSSPLATPRTTTSQSDTPAGTPAGRTPGGGLREGLTSTFSSVGVSPSGACERRPAQAAHQLAAGGAVAHAPWLSCLSRLARFRRKPSLGARQTSPTKVRGCPRLAPPDKQRGQTRSAEKALASLADPTRRHPQSAPICERRAAPRAARAGVQPL